VKPDPEATRSLRLRLSEVPLVMGDAVGDLARAGAHLPLGQRSLWLEGLAPQDVRAAIEGGREYAREVIGGGGSTCLWQLPEDKAVARGATYRSPGFDDRLAFIRRFRDAGAYCQGEVAVNPFAILMNYQTRQPGSNQVLLDRTRALQRLVTDAEHRRLVREVFGIELESPLTLDHFAAAAQRLCAPAPVSVRRAGCQLVIEQPLDGPYYSAVLIGPIAEGPNGLDALAAGGGALQGIAELIALEVVITQGPPRGVGRSTRQTASNQVQRINMAQVIFGINMYYANHNHETFVSCAAAYLKAASLYALGLHRVFTS
jgi:hypothetical protein